MTPREQLDALLDLKDGWNADGDAPKPNDAAMGRAACVLRRLHEHRVPITSVEADALGGVAVHADGATGKMVWIACMNSGKDVITFVEGARVAAYELLNVGGGGGGLTLGEEVRSGRSN